MKLYVVWNIDRARPVSDAKLPLSQARSLADRMEQASLRGDHYTAISA